jgi:hypothetical protein
LIHASLSNIFHYSILCRGRLIWILRLSMRTPLAVSKLYHQASRLPVDDRFIPTHVFSFVVALEIVFVLVSTVPLIPTVVGTSF